jgi:hypothetical protein
VLLAQAVFGGIPSPLAMKAIAEILLFPIVPIISLIPHLTSAAFTGFTVSTTTIATLLCNEQSFCSEPILSLDCSVIFDELGDDLIGCGGDRRVVFHHELQSDFPLVIPWNSVKVVENVLLLTYLGEGLYTSLCVSSVGVIGRSPWAEIVILDIPIDLR